MSKQLYLEAIEALRQRVEAMGEDELEGLQDPDIVPMSNVLGSITDYIDLALAAGIDSPEEFGEYLETTQGDLIDEALLYLAVWTVVRQRDLLMEKISERRQFFAAESTEPPPIDDDPDLFTGGDWDPEEDDDLFEDDPDFAREYIGDDDGEDDESGL